MTTEQKNLEIAQAEKNYNESVSAVRAFTKEIAEKRNQEFIDAGGCTTCQGEGRVVTWSTLDGPSWTEYGPCPNTCCTAMQLGRNRSLYQGNYLYPFNPGIEETKFNGLSQNVENLKNVLEATKAKWEVAKGKRVKVIARRRKNHAPISAEGVVFWVGYSAAPARAYNAAPTTKIGFKDDAGNTFWTTEKSVELIDTKVIEPDKFVLVGELKRYSYSGSAILVCTKEAELWMPLSQMKRVNDITWIIPKWLAEKNGLTG